MAKPVEQKTERLGPGYIKKKKATAPRRAAPKRSTPSRGPKQPRRKGILLRGKK